MARRRSAAGLAATMVAALMLAGYVSGPERPVAAAPDDPDRRVPARAPTAAPKPSGSPTPTPTRTPSPSSRGGAASAPSATTLVMNGDLLWHNSFWFGAREDARRRGRSGFDFAPALAGLRPVVAGADLAICHWSRRSPRRADPSRTTRGSRSRRRSCRRSRPRATTSAPPPPTTAWTTGSGAEADPRRPRPRRARPPRHRPDGGRGPAPDGRRHPHRRAGRRRLRHLQPQRAARTGREAWSVTGLEPRGLLAQARRARAAGADIVVVAAHVGTEFSSRVNAQQRALARTLTASPDVDLVYMHHTHVVQPWTRMNGKWVIYGLGNTVAQHETDIPQGAEGVTARTALRARAERALHRDPRRVHPHLRHPVRPRPSVPALPGLRRAATRPAAPSGSGSGWPSAAPRPSSPATTHQDFVAPERTMRPEPVEGHSAPGLRPLQPDDFHAPRRRSRR